MPPAATLLSIARSVTLLHCLAPGGDYVFHALIHSFYRRKHFAGFFP